MAEKSGVSKVFAAVLVVLTVSVVAGIIVMVTFYKIQYDRSPPTPRPPTTATTEAPPPVARLPRSLLPSAYHLLVQTHFYAQIQEAEEANATTPSQNTLFTGNSTVHFLCVEDTRSVFLHSRDLRVSHPRVVDEDSGRDLPVSYLQVQDASPHFLEVRLAERLRAGGNYSLFLSFSGDTSPHLEGLYLSTYLDGTPEFEGDPKAERFLAATNFEPAAARRVFPCFDEPDLRAKFFLTVVHRPGTTARANTEPLDSSQVGDWMITEFEATPPMSTYLLAFLVSQLDMDESKTPAFGVTIRTHARPEAVRRRHTEYAHQVAGRISDFLEEKFGLGYVVRTVDQVALPDLEPLAMENWGLITYQETTLLYEPGASSLLHKEELAVTVAHELVHQWFGNLVSIRWWNSLWLKESFATYLSYLAVDQVESSFNMLDSFVTDSLLRAFEVDALASSRPLVPPEDAVQTYESIYEMYDAISYDKGAILLRMLENYMRPEDFLKGVKDYLETFKFQSADHRDLWASLQKAELTGNIRVSEFMEPWISQSGFPVVTIDTTSGKVSQKQFLYNDTAESSLLWNVHIDFLSSKTGRTGDLNLNVRGPVTKAEFLAEDGEWILANVNCSGYFRVNYNRENWESLFLQLEAEPNRIPLMNRGQIIDDIFNLARAGLVDLTLALNSTRFLRDEVEFLPWNAAMRNMRYLVRMFDRSEVFGPMQAYLRSQVETLYQFFRNQTDNSTVPHHHSQQHSQLLAVEVACANELPACVSMATAKYAEWMNSNSSTNSIPPNLRAALYCQAVAAGGQQQWEFAWTTYLKSRDTSEREQLRHALTCSRSTWLLSRLLDYTLDPEKIRLMDAASTIRDVSHNAAGHALAWNFIRANWDYISASDSMWLIQEVSSRFSTQFELQELERFLGDQAPGSSCGEQAVEQTRVNIRWVQENRDKLLRWFQRAVEAPPTRQ